MKRIIITTLGLCLSAALALGQSFNPAVGYTRTQVVDSLAAGTTISALAADSAGNLFFLANSAGDTTLYRSPASNPNAPVALFSYGSPVFGSFVKINGSTLYFSESTNGTIQSLPVSAAPETTPDLVKTIPNGFDLVAIGSELYASVSDSDFANNQVFRLTPDNDPLDAIVATGGASGPVVGRADGSLIYGATTFNGGAGGMYSFTPAQLSAAAGSGLTLMLADGTRLFPADSVSNQYLAYRDETNLFRASSAGNPSTIDRFDLANGFQEAVGASGNFEFFGGLTTTSDALYVAVTDASFSSSAIYRIVPEPGSAVLLGFSVLALTLRRRR